MPRTAKARMLWGSISTSERVNRLSLKAALLYTWLLPHADDQGRMSGSPATIKAVVVPMRTDITESEILDLLHEIEHQNLITLYLADERRLETGDFTPNDFLLQINDWCEYQALREPKASRYPPPRGWNKDRVESGSRDKSGRYHRPES